MAHIIQKEIQTIIRSELFSYDVISRQVYICNCCRVELIKKIGTKVTTLRTGRLISKIERIGDASV